MSAIFDPNRFDGERYAGYASFIRRHSAVKVQKLSVDVGGTCPNRDGTLGRGGCTYCNNRTFTPGCARPGQSVTEQLEAGKRFFARKYPHMRYWAYFQSHTNTYGSPEVWMQRYDEALAVPGVTGLVVGTRPDCMPGELLDYFEKVARERFVCVEYGVESVCDETLCRVNRGHDTACSERAIRRTAERGIPVCVHMIVGLPGETWDDWMAQARWLSALPVSVVKLHQLQIVRGTPIARAYADHPESFSLFDTPERYADTVVDYLERLHPDIVVERFTSQAPPAWLVAPAWGWKNHVFVEWVRRRLIERNTWQGRLTEGLQAADD